MANKEKELVQQIINNPSTISSIKIKSSISNIVVKNQKTIVKVLDVLQKELDEKFAQETPQQSPMEKLQEIRANIEKTVDFLDNFATKDDQEGFVDLLFKAHGTTCTSKEEKLKVVLQSQIEVDKLGKLDTNIFAGIMAAKIGLSENSLEIEEKTNEMLNQVLALSNDVLEECVIYKYLNK